MSVSGPAKCAQIRTECELLLGMFRHRRDRMSSRRCCLLPRLRARTAAHRFKRREEPRHFNAALICISSLSISFEHAPSCQALETEGSVSLVARCYNLSVLFQVGSLEVVGCKRLSPPRGTPVQSRKSENYTTLIQ